MMKAHKIAVPALAAAFVLGSAAMTYAQTGTRSTSTTATRTTTSNTNTQNKNRVDCPGNAENSQGKAKQHNPNCHPVR